MRAACKLLIERFTRSRFRIRHKTPSLVLHHVQHAHSSSRVPIAPQDSSTATARLKSNETVETSSLPTLNQSVQACTGAKPLSISEGQNARNSGSADRLSEYWERKVWDASKQRGTSVSIAFKGLQPYRERKSEPIPTRQKYYSITVSQVTRGNAEAGLRQRSQITLGNDREEQVGEGSQSKFTHELGPGSPSANKTLPATSSPDEKTRNAGTVLLGPTPASNKFHMTMKRSDKVMHNGKLDPLVESRANLVQSVQSEGGNFETFPQPPIQVHGQRKKTSEPREDDSIAVPPSSDPLFAFLRNPKGTRTGPVSKRSKKLSTEDGKAERRPANKQQEPSFYRVIREASVQDIEQKLAGTAHHNPNVNGVQFMLKELIEVRHIQPQARHYEALILAHCEAGHGSAAALYPILAEMEQEKSGIGASTLSAVLKVLSIHPDAHLLSTTLSALASQWITPSIADTAHTILTLTRLNQFELALPHLERLISTSPPPNNYLQTPIPQFLYSTILYRLASPAVADHTAALHLLYLLNDNYLPISNVCISYLLDSAAEALHLDLVLYIWRSHVDTKYIIPSTGLCRNVLLTAARNGNSELAVKAARVLEVRGYANTKEEGGGVGLQVEIRRSRWGRASSNWLRRVRVRIVCAVSAMDRVIHCEARADRVVDRRCASGWMERTLRTALSVDAPIPLFSCSISARMG